MRKGSNSNPSASLLAQPGRLFRGSALLLGALTLGGLTGCSGGTKGNPANQGDFVVNLISTGQGQIYPYRVARADSNGNPTQEILNIESQDLLEQQHSAANPILPVATWPVTATLPDGTPGNHYLQITFSNEIDVESILSTELADFQTNSGLAGSVEILALDPNTETRSTLQGQAFVGGVTYFNRGGLVRVEAVGLNDDEDGLEVLDIGASGFPMGFTGDIDLVNKNTFVFVADTDDDLDTLETFDPFGQNLIIQIKVNGTVLNTDGNLIEQTAGVATTVGPDPNPTNVLGAVSGLPRIFPGNGEAGVDPTDSILVEFTKPVQPALVGTFFDDRNLVPDSAGIRLTFDALGVQAPVLYYANPVSFADFTQYRITPAYVLPGNTDFTVFVDASIVEDLNSLTLGQDSSTTFRTGQGPGIVNAPVAPDALYVGFGGAEPGVSVIDLNGFGQGTNGLEPDPNTGLPTITAGDTNYALRNPDLTGNPSAGLSQGTGPLDAGSNGVLTLVEDTSGNVNLLPSPLVGRVADIHIGAPLDLVFNNSNVNSNAGGANQINPATQALQPGNGIQIRPIPNPPKLVFPPPNPARAIFGEEPVTTTSMPPPGPMGRVLTMNPPCSVSPPSRLTQSEVSDLVTGFSDGVFVGPQDPPGSPPPPPAFCPFTSRQQVGHFLYVLDPTNSQIVVVNSNRFTVLDTIQLSDPVAMTMSPTLSLIAVSNFASGLVSFIDIDPRSPTFNTVVAETIVADGPAAIAWQPDGEDVLVLSPTNNSLSVIDATDFSLTVVATGSLTGPIDLAVTERYVQTGNTSGIYNAYILNSNGTIAVYESGPIGVNGIGFQDIIGLVEPTFPRATSVKLNYLAAQGGVFVTHSDNQGVGVVSDLQLVTSPQGPQPTQQNSAGFILPPTFRQKEWGVVQTFGGSDPSLPLNQRLSGNSPIAVTTDEVNNFGAGTNQITNFNQGIGQSVFGHSSKGARLAAMGGVPAVPFQPRFLFVALSDAGAIDVFDLDTRAKVRTIPIPGVSTLSGYWKQ